MISRQEFLNKKINIFPRIMSCNHANLNIHTTHSTNIDRKTLLHFSSFCDLKSKIQKKQKTKKTKRKENENLLRIESVCILRSQVNFDIS